MLRRPRARPRLRALGRGEEHESAAYPNSTAPPSLCRWIRLLLVADDHAAAPAPGQVPPGEVDQGGDPVPAAEQGDQVQRQPAKPGERSPGPNPDGELGDR